MAFRKMNDPNIQQRLEADNAAAARLLDTRKLALNVITRRHNALTEREQIFCGTVRAKLDVLGFIRDTEHAWLMAIAERLQPGFAKTITKDTVDQAAATTGVSETAFPEF
ncbi:hypothetical protein [Ralstonia sp. ASV6]|uniref:hypothetical protein n=1 Tax=Ralstonia sp. ASV6 TaxID=2795124 RepID=UPI0018EA478B|nr:hypothetical protein [Ralstonia sp. ASV6]